ncbi:hypothetical protein HZC09_01680 [Candidatus Micrarchaeota archaeon]|nr:hypothetical protein [Candidatus Micrarchaeota archaeon]
MDYKKLEQMEDEEDIRECNRIMKEIKEGKQKLYTQEEFEKMTGTKLEKKKTK